jgi:hypothetical protein
MTVKEVMTKVCEERETFPNGWNTDIKEVYAKSGRNLFEKKQKWVYLLTIKTPYNHEADTLTLFRDKAKAKAAMEEDIRDTLATGRFDPDDLVRDEVGDNAHIGEDIDWTVEVIELVA